MVSLKNAVSIRADMVRVIRYDYPCHPGNEHAPCCRSVDYDKRFWELGILSL